MPGRAKAQEPSPRIFPRAETAESSNVGRTRHFTLNPFGIDFVLAGKHVEVLHHPGPLRPVRRGPVREGVMPDNQVPGLARDRDRL